MKHLKLARIWPKKKCELNWHEEYDGTCPFLRCYQMFTTIRALHICGFTIVKQGKIASILKGEI